MKESVFYVRCSIDGGETFENVSRACPNPLSAILVMRRKVKEMAQQLINDNKDFSLCQTNDSRWSDAWGYANNGYMFTCNCQKTIFEVVDGDNL